MLLCAIICVAAGDVYWLNSLEGGHACLLVDSYGDLADGVALEEAFLLIEGYSSACSDNIGTAGRLRKALAAVEKRRGTCVVPPRLLQGTFPLRVCRGEASACGELVAFLKRLNELNNGAGKTRTITEDVRHSRSSGSTNFNGPKRSRNARVINKEGNGVFGNALNETTKGDLNKVGHQNMCLPTEPRTTAARRRAHASDPILATGRATTSSRRIERQPRNHHAYTPNGVHGTTQGHSASTDRSWPPPPPPPPPGGFSGPSLTASGLQKRRVGGYPGTCRLGIGKDDDRGPVAKTRQPSPAAIASAPGGAPLTPLAAVAGGTTKNQTSNTSSAARSEVWVAVSPNLKRDAAVAVTAIAAHPPTSSVGTKREIATSVRTRTGTGRVGLPSRTTERGEVGTRPRSGGKEMPNALHRNGETFAGITEAGKRRAGRRVILRWMDRLGVKVEWSLLAAEGPRCHHRFSSGEVLCELAAAVDYAASGGRGLPLSEIPSCPGRFVLRGTCGAPANAARAKHNVRTALSAFAALGGIGGTWLRGETAILEGDHEATWGLLYDVYKRYGHLRSHRALRPRQKPPPLSPPPPPQEQEQEQPPQQQQPRRRQQGQQRHYQQRRTAAETTASETTTPLPHRSPPPPSPGWPNEGSNLLRSHRKLFTKFAESILSAEGAHPSRLKTYKTSADNPTKPIDVEKIGVIIPASAVKAAGVGPPGTDGVGRVEPQPIPLPAHIGRVANTPNVTKAGTKPTGTRAERRISAPVPTRNASLAGLPSPTRRPGISSSAGGVISKTFPLEQDSTATASTVAAISISPRSGGTQVMKTCGEIVVAKEDAAARLERQSVTPAGGARAVDENVSAFSENKDGKRIICSAEREFGITGSCPFASGRNAYGMDLLLAGETRAPCRTKYLGVAAPALVGCADKDDGDDEATCDRVGGIPIEEPKHPKKEVLLPGPEQGVHHSDQRQEGLDLVLGNSHVVEKAVSETEKWLEWDPTARDSTVAGISTRIWGGNETPHDEDVGCGTCGYATSWGCILGNSGQNPVRQADIGGADAALTESVDRRPYACNGRSQQPEGTSFASYAAARPCSKGGTLRSAAFGNVVGAIPRDELAMSPECSRGNPMTGRPQSLATFGRLCSSAVDPAAAMSYPGGFVGLEGRSATNEHNNMVGSIDADQTNGPKRLAAKRRSFDDFHCRMTTCGSSLQLQGNVGEENPHEFQRLFQLGVEPRAVQNSYLMGSIANNNSGSVHITQSSSAEARKCERKAVQPSVCLLSPCRSTRSSHSVAAGGFSDPFERSAASDLLPVAHHEVDMTPSVHL
ncbi:unnamed protein product [Ectocarpus sp. 12 AP-2014]